FEKTTCFAPHGVPYLNNRLSVYLNLEGLGNTSRLVCASYFIWNTIYANCMDNTPTGLHNNSRGHRPW
ncbi:MAG: hypothetical protein JW833_07470, partial [Prolixibacteraceae bacterium]|nr:hypothetical protein [Prolixibacteraceae bacterium]